jgi:hypothetical protein
LRRPVLHQFTRTDLLQLAVGGQKARFGPQGRLPRPADRLRWRDTARARGYLSAYRGASATQTLADDSIEPPLATPREMSLRSARVSTRRERRRAGGVIPPGRANRISMS